MSAKSKSTASIQEKMNQLNALVAWFDGEEFQLEEAFDRFKEAEQLAASIEDDLSSMKNEITILKKRFDGDAE